MPRISIITPSLNQGEFIEETIRSVLLQNYPALEFIVIDGGSTDQTIDILNKYSNFISYWISEPDKGQANAINKGLAKANGNLIAWLNSDDLYNPGALLAVGQAYALNEGALIAGSVANFDGQKEWISNQPGLLNGVITFWREQSYFHQPGIFIPKSLWDECGPLDESLYFCMDLALLCNIEQHHPQVVILDQQLAKFRVHPKAKSTKHENIGLLEQILVSRSFHQSDPALRLEHDTAIARGLAQRTLTYLLEGNLDAVCNLIKLASRVNLLGSMPIPCLRMARYLLRCKWNNFRQKSRV